MTDFPASFHPVDDGVPDEAVSVEVFQHLPGQTDRLVEWSGGDELHLNGGPVVLLPGKLRSEQRLVGLGDYAVRDDDSYRAWPADGFYQRFRLVSE